MKNTFEQVNQIKQLISDLPKDLPKAHVLVDQLRQLIEELEKKSTYMAQVFPDQYLDWARNYITIHKHLYKSKVIV